jgi:ubiquinone/menaquinone biosynthesis C-methylase UbiE
MARSGLAPVKSAAERWAGGLVFGSRAWLARRIAEVAPSLADGRVLEIGSGRHDYGADAYSLKPQFPATCDFVQSDLNPDYGHLVVDVTSMDFDSEYDAVLCISVLEHVDRFWEAIPRMQRALKPGGRLILSVPMTFPYHDEPADYYRFTTHGVRFLLREFSDVQIRHRGPRRLPFTVLAVAIK